LEALLFESITINKAVKEVVLIECFPDLLLKQLVYDCCSLNIAYLALILLIHVLRYIHIYNTA